MNSTSRFLPNNAPSSGSSSRSQRQQSEVEQRINEILFHSMQLQRTLWLAVRHAGGTLTLDETATDPLWNLEYARDPADKNKIIIKATRLPDPSGEQLEKLAAALLGTKNDPGDAIDKVGLGEYPKSYVVKALQPQVIFAAKIGEKDGVWMTRAEFDLLPKEPPQHQQEKIHGL